jgi:triacylglycerol lipase
MLAKLLRFTIAMQMAFGAALGYWLSARQNTATALAVVLLAAIAMPPLANLLTVLYSFMRSRAAEPLALWFKAMRGECLANVQFFLLRQPWAFAPPTLQAAASTSPQRIPVLLVHGFACNHRVWDALAPVLLQQGHSLLAVNLEPLFTSIDDYAPQLERAVQSLRQQTGQEQIALLGHSMGGLAIRAWMRRYGSQHAARAITLGTPHVGTQAHALVNTPNGLQMAWRSKWLAELAASESDRTRSLFRIAITPQDNIVHPQRAQTLAGVVPTVFEGLGHLQLCSAPAVSRWVCAELALL